MPSPIGDPQFWVGLEGLVWWSRNQPLSVPVVTTGPASQGGNAGNLNMPGTTSLNGPLDYGAEGGFRMYAGVWFDTAHSIGLDGSFFILGEQSAGFGVVDPTGTGGFVINEPVAGAPFSTQVSAPGVETGAVNVDSCTNLGGGDINLLYNLYRADGWTINILGGYRFVELDESLSINASSNLFTTAVYTDNFGNVLATAPPGSQVVVYDQFDTRNSFNGGQIGTEFQYQWEALVGGRFRQARHRRHARSGQHQRRHHGISGKRQPRGDDRWQLRHPSDWPLRHRSVRAGAGMPAQARLCPWGQNLGRGRL